MLKTVVLFSPQDSFIVSKESSLFEIEIFFNIINVFFFSFLMLLIL